MKYKSQIFILFVVLICIYCFGTGLPPRVKEFFVQHSSANHTKGMSPKKNIQLRTAMLNNAMLNKLLSGEQDESYVAIVSSHTINSLDRDNSYSIEAHGRIVENGVAVNAGDLIIGNVTINPDNDNLYHYTYPLSDGKALFGNSVDAEIDDGSVNLRRTRVTMVVPKEFYPSTMSLPKSTVDRTTHYSLTWAPDANNQFGQVQIQVSFNKGLSQYYNPSVPSSIEDLVYRVADNGNYIIPQADLARFPMGSYVSISIARAWLDNVSSNIAYVTITEARTSPVLVIDPVACNNQYTITGNDIVCSGSENYTVPNLPAGSTILWSVTPNIATVDQNGTVTPTGGSGTITLSADITTPTPCGSFTRAKTISVGADWPNMNIYGPEYVSCGQIITYSVPNVPGAGYQWSYPSSWIYNYGLGTNSITFQIPDYAYSSTSGEVRVLAYNACNNTILSTLYVNSSCGEYYYYSMSPNPATSTVTVSAKQTTPKGEKVDKTITEINIYDQQGKLKKHEKFGKVKTATLNISALDKGVYFVEIVDDNLKERQQLIIQK